MAVNDNMKPGWRFSLNLYSEYSWGKPEQANARMLGEIARLMVMKPVKLQLFPVVSGIFPMVHFMLD